LHYREAIAINLDPLGIPSWRAEKFEDLEVWQKPLANGVVAIGLFNRSGNPRPVKVSWKCLGIAGDWNVRDLWSRAPAGRAARRCT